MVAGITMTASNTEPASSLDPAYRRMGLVIRARCVTVSSS